MLRKMILNLKMGMMNDMNDFLFKKFKEFSENSYIGGNELNDNVLLIDGMNSYIRCFAATPTMNEDGDHIGGVSGFLKSIGMVVRQFRPSRVIIVFDGKGGNKTKQSIYSGYKEGRTSMTKLNRSYDFQTKEQEQQSMRWQLKLLLSMCEHLPVTIIAMDNIEADDVIGYISQHLESEDRNSIIMSTDKDFLQLISSHCRVYNPVKKKLYHVDTVLEEYNIHPNNFILYRSVTGDKSDNIKGIKGIGPQTFKKCFPETASEETMTLDGLLLLSENKQSENSAYKKIVENKDSLELNYKLMNLKNAYTSQSSKLQILENFQRTPNQLNKLSLTKILSECNMIDVFGNLNEWISFTWFPLTRWIKNVTDRT